MNNITKQSTLSISLAIGLIIGAFWVGTSYMNVQNRLDFVEKRLDKIEKILENIEKRI